MVDAVIAKSSDWNETSLPCEEERNDETKGPEVLPGENGCGRQGIYYMLPTTRSNNTKIE